MTGSLTPSTYPTDTITVRCDQCGREGRDSTVEKVAVLLSENPKGILLRRDEMAGWVSGMDRYSAGDRAFWLESWGGGSYTVHRVKHEQSIRIPHLAVSINGTTQPDKLADLVRQDDSDGLWQRMLWTYPERVSFKRPKVSPDTSLLVTAFERLSVLAMDTSQNGEPIPRIIPFAERAAEVMEVVCLEMEELEAGAPPVMQGVYAKAAGRMAILALVLTYLDWAVTGEAEPIEIDVDKTVMAANLIADYFVPMAERVFNTLPQTEADAVEIARWIEAKNLNYVNPSLMQRGEDKYPGPKDRKRIDAALETLVVWHIVKKPMRSGEFRKLSLDHSVNPRFLER